VAAGVAEKFIAGGRIVDRDLACCQINLLGFRKC
jgi:hypothetical protein